ncbi:ABC transporter permease [Leifsonia sp. LS1]|uniref:ABC transporter permease subunit n=1 Tax=unclassified Leifsonia TaxID=2663824 RepID=UPI001CBCDF37|nr:MULTISPECIES: ABC transporter permease subunit [unclassified Leifsonia]UAJ81225.1 ABC transporter permease subunit [Leifsonia sp. ZF2019]GIT79235.1 ABC transporter permease [Leifsonia sp. LS1]
MTTTAPARPHEHSTLGRLSFPRVVRSEWIKLRTLRSTFWTLASVIVLVIGIAALVATAIPEKSVLFGEVPQSQRAGIEAQAAQFATSASTAGLTFAALVIAVLGVLVISGEFSTGMIRSSFAAVPRRFPVFLAKALVLFGVSFVVGLVSSAASWAVALPILNGKGYPGDLLASDTLWAIVGAGAYLGLVAVFALGVGAILKSTAGGIAAALGVLLVLPIIANLVSSLTKTQWVQDAGHYLLSSAGTGLAGVTNGTLEPWANILTAIAWAVVSFVVGALLLQRRDA